MMESDDEEEEIEPISNFLEVYVKEEIVDEEESPCVDDSPLWEESEQKYEPSEMGVVAEGDDMTVGLENVEACLSTNEVQLDEEQAADVSTAPTDIVSTTYGEDSSHIITLDNISQNLTFLGPPLRTFKCETCGRCFSNRKSLNRHYRLHTGEKPYMCKLCGRCFSQTCSLAVHIRTHTGDKPYKCDTCEKCFYDRSALSRHLLIHTGEKPFVCIICGKRFNQKTSLKKHHRLYHKEKSSTDEDRVQCNVCGKRLSGNLKRHMLIHTGEKPYKCPVCGKGFTQSNQVSYHIDSHLECKLSQFKCWICNISFNNSTELLSHELSHKNEQT